MQKVVINVFGLINPQLLLGALVFIGIGAYYLIRPRTHVAALRALPKPLKWAYASWLPEHFLLVLARAGGTLFLAFGLALIGLFIAEQLNPSIARHP